MTPRRPARFFAATLVMLLAGCAFSAKPDLSRRYLLSGLPASAMPAAPLDSALALGVFSADLPAYLDRPQMVTRQGDQIHLNEYERWGEPLGSGFARALAQDIMLLSGSNRVAVFPLPQAFGQEFELYAQVAQFDGVPGGEATLSVLWRMTGPGGRPTYYTKNSIFTGAVRAGGYVEALNGLVGDLAREVVASLPQVRAAKAAAQSLPTPSP